MDTFINLFTIIAFVFCVPVVAIYFKPYRKHTLIFSFFWILFVVWYYKHDDTDKYTYTTSREGLYNYDSNKSKKEMNQEFHKDFISLPVEKQQEIIKNLDVKEIKGFRQ
jgi:hypothetical protein